MSAYLLLPGLMCDAAVWAPLEPYWPEGASCTVVDYGEADSLAEMARRALAQAPPGPLHVAGHSMGGRVALELCRQAPQRVASLALLNTGYLPLAEGEAGQKELATRARFLQLARSQGVRAMAQDWVQGMVAPQRLAQTEFIEAIVAMIARQSEAIFAAQIHALIHRPDATDVLRGLTMPVSVIAAAQDSWATVAQHEAMVALTPHARLHVLACGHMAPMEDPAPTAQAILSPGS